MAERLPFTLRLYRRMTATATPFAPFLLARRLKRGKENAARLRERRGQASQVRPQGPLIWVHGASVGEMLAALPLITRLCEQRLNVLVTSGTVTSANLATERLPRGAIHHFVPLDTPRFVSQFIQHWRPDLALFVESDLWPNLILACSEARIPLVLLNGRMSEKSFKNWRNAPKSAAALLDKFDLCLAQSTLDAERFQALGAPRVRAIGNLKLDAPAPPADAGKLSALTNAIGARPVIAAASTHPGEDESVLEAHWRLRQHFPGLLTIIAPRHPERGRSIFDLAASARLPAALRSFNMLPGADTEIYIADTIGELGLLYRATGMVYMGGSLAAHGGQNPIEAAKLDTAIVHGPHVWNFKDIYTLLDAARGAVEITDAGQLTECFGYWLSHPEARQATADAARKTVERLGGALEHTMAEIEPYLLQLRLEHRVAGT